MRRLKIKLKAKPVKKVNRRKVASARTKILSGNNYAAKYSQ